MNWAARRIFAARHIWCYFGLPPRLAPPPLVEFRLWFPRTLAGRLPEENAPGFADGVGDGPLGFVCGYPRFGCVLGRVDGIGWAVGFPGLGRVPGLPG